MRKPTILGVAGAVLACTAGYMFVISPQAAATAKIHAELTTVETSNAAASARIPVLKAQLANISGSVAGLRAMSQRVPPTIDLPALYEELAAVAAAAGPGVSVASVTVTIPTLLTPPAPAAAATTTTDATATATPGKTATPAPVASAVLASYTVNMDVTATADQAAAFIKALGATKRMNVVSSSGVSGGANGAPGTAHVSATFYLQQVDVDGLAAQIEALAAARGTGTPTTTSSSSGTPTTQSTGLPTDPPSSQATGR